MNIASLEQRVYFRFRVKLFPAFIGFLRKIIYRRAGLRIGLSTVLPKLHFTWPHQIQIGSSCVLEADIYFKFDGIWSPGPSIVIGDQVFVGRGCEFNIRKGITIGDCCAIASGAKFIDHDHAITGSRIDETPGPEAEITIGTDVWIGANVIVLKGVTIGNSAVVAAGSVVTKSIPAGEIWAGVPARKLSSRQSRQCKHKPFNSLS